jgi:hypothetical protein
MDFHPATTKVIKAGRSESPFLLFFGNRKQEDEDGPTRLLPTVVLLLLVATILGICIYAFVTGRLG